MREHSRDRGRLEDMLKYAQNVEQIVSGITYEQFVADIRIYYSVMKNITEAPVLRGFSRTEAEEKAFSLLKKMGLDRKRALIPAAKGLQLSTFNLQLSTWLPTSRRSSSSASRSPTAAAS